MDIITRTTVTMPVKRSENQARGYESWKRWVFNRRHTVCNHGVL